MTDQTPNQTAPNERPEDGLGHACRMDLADLDRRRRQGEAVRARLTRIERTELGARLTFDGGAESLVRAFVHDEAQCCPFFEFAVELVGDAVVLTVTAPGEESAQAQMDQLYRSFRDGVDGQGRPNAPAD